MQIQHRRQVMPATLRPDVGDVAAPHLIGLFGGELAVQPVWDIWPLNRSLLVCVRAWLLADQAQLAHQPTHAKTANAYAILAQHAQDAATARRSSTLVEQLVNLTAQCNAACINTAASKPMGVVARPHHAEG
jgi:hypothetical protein